MILVHRANIFSDFFHHALAWLLVLVLLCYLAGLDVLVEDRFSCGLVDVHEFGRSADRISLVDQIYELLTPFVADKIISCLALPPLFYLFRRHRLRTACLTVVCCLFL